MTNSRHNGPAARRRLFPGCVLLACALAGPVSGAVGAELAETIDAIFSDYDSTHSPGCALGVIQEGRLTYQRGYGMASLEHDVPITENTVFYTGSVSKQFAAAAILMASREGMLSLDDDIRRFLPEIPDYGETITVRHLVHHTSGLRDYLGLMSLAGIPFENVMTPDRVIDLIARQKAPNFGPGEQYLYSNSGYFLLAQIVGRATGRSLREYSNEKLFTPLDMRHTHFHDDRHEVVANRALAYSQTPDGYVVNWSPTFDQVGSGGLLSTVVDLVEWDRSFYDDRLGKGFWQAMQQTSTLRDGEEIEYAFGLTIDEYNGYRRVQHGGAMFGYRAFLSRFPSEHLTVALLCNLANVDSGRLANQVSDLFLPESTSTTSSGAPAERHTPPTIRLTDEQRQPLVGDYEIFGGLSVSVLSGEDGLSLLLPRDEQVPLRAIDGTEFWLDSPDFPSDSLKGEDRLRFERSADGSVEALIVTLGGAERHARRLAARETRSGPISAWIGSYWSEELGALAVIERSEDGTLSYRVGTTEPVEVLVRQDDTFEIPGMTATATSSGDRITGFTIDAGRVQGIVFERRAQ